MTILGLILARAGSRGLPNKCVRNLCGRPLIAYTFDHALASRRITNVVLTTDSEPAKKVAQCAGIEVIDRPAMLAGDTATVDAAARHAVETWEARRNRAVRIVVLLYGNIPMRAEGLIDRAVDRLIETGADSVRSVAPVSKQHPDWIHRLDGDRMIQFRPNSIYRRQDLEPLYYHDGAVAAVTRDALFGALLTPDDHQSFLGHDRRAIVQQTDETVDIDEPVDLLLAEALLRNRSPTTTGKPRTECRSTVPPSNPPSVRAIRIGNHLIARERPTFVIAEAGVNHNGSFDTALCMVDVAARAGADAIKFQVFRASRLASAHAPTARYQRGPNKRTSQQELLAGLELAPDEFLRVKQRCDERSILFLATPFGVKEMTWLEQNGVPAVKMASTDLITEPLLAAACATGLPLILSTGAAERAEIEQAVQFVAHTGAKGRLILLHCVSCYPTPMDAINLRAVATLYETFGVPTGLSDHTTSTRTGALAVSVGACVIEKYFTLDPNAPGPDHAMSLNPDQLTEYIARIREAERALVTGMLGLNPIEQEVRRVARKSIVATQLIRSGEIIRAEKLTLKRPGTGLSPNDLPALIGRRATADIPGDTLLTWDMTTA